MFIAALLTIARTWKQPVSTNRWMDEEDVVCIYSGILLSHNREWNYSICSHMDRSRNYHTKWNKSDQERQISDFLVCGIFKNDTNELLYKT